MADYSYASDVAATIDGVRHTSHDDDRRRRRRYSDPPPLDLSSMADRQFCSIIGSDLLRNYSVNLDPVSTNVNSSLLGREEEVNSNEANLSSNRKDSSSWGNDDDDGSPLSPNSKP
ncbi:MAG: hypothetical protein Q9191_002456, partial [Dirinaria sp. TL-2023a]